MHFLNESLQTRFFPPLSASKCNKKFNIHFTNSNFIKLAHLALNLSGLSRYFFAVPQLFPKLCC